MKLFILLLIFPCWVQAQNNFKVSAVLDCKCYFFTHEIWAISFDSTVTAKLNTKDEFCPVKGDSIYYNGKVWMWHKKQLHLDGNAVMENRGLYMKAISPAGNSLVSYDTNRVKVYYEKTETVGPPIGCYNSVSPPGPRLYVIDGFQTTNTTAVDSLLKGKNFKKKILKDADATTIYGVIAANGATIITTYKKHHKQ